MRCPFCSASVEASEASTPVGRPRSSATPKTWRANAGPGRDQHAVVGKGRAQLVDERHDRVVATVHDRSPADRHDVQPRQQPDHGAVGRGPDELAVHERLAHECRRHVLGGEEGIGIGMRSS